MHFEVDTVNTMNYKNFQTSVKPAQWAKVLATKTDDWSSVPETTMVEGQNLFLQVVL